VPAAAARISTSLIPITRKFTAERLRVKAESTDRILRFATDGRFYSLDAGSCRAGRGFGEPIRLTIDLAQRHDVVRWSSTIPPNGWSRSVDGRGFVVRGGDAVAQTRRKQVLTPATRRGAPLLGLKGDHVRR